MDVIMMSATEILVQLDQSADKFTFSMLDNGYIYPADVRMSIYRDASDWLMIIEHLVVFGDAVRTGFADGSWYAVWRHTRS